MQFIAGIVFILTEGLPQEKLVALRQCIEKIHVNNPADEIKMQICEVPVGNLKTLRELTISF